MEIEPRYVTTSVPSSNLSREYSLGVKTERKRTNGGKGSHMKDLSSGLSRRSETCLQVEGIFRAWM